MSYETEIVKPEQEPYAELYQIASGTDIDYYTSYGKKVVHEGVPYLARRIKRGAFSRSKDIKATRVKVTAPLSTKFLQYVTTTPIDETTVRIIRKFLTDESPTIQLFLGVVLGVTVSGNSAIADCESFSGLLRREIPPFSYSSQCNNTLFDDGCKLIKANYAVPATVNLTDGITLTSNTFAEYTQFDPPGYFTWGTCEVGNTKRWIVHHSGNTIKIHAPFFNMKSGSQVIVYPGCDLVATTCEEKFGNDGKFFGFRSIPDKNPVYWGFQ